VDLYKVRTCPGCSVERSGLDADRPVWDDGLVSFGGVLYLASIIVFALIGVLLLVDDDVIELRTGIAFISFGLAALAAAGGPWWGARRI
jgi:hypothetical protein